MENDELNELRLQAIRAHTRIKQLEAINEELLDAMRAITEACQISEDPLACVCADIARAAIEKATAGPATS